MPAVVYTNSHRLCKEEWPCLYVGRYYSPWLVFDQARPTADGQLGSGTPTGKSEGFTHLKGPLSEPVRHCRS